LDQINYEATRPLDSYHIAVYNKNVHKYFVDIQSLATMEKGLIMLEFTPDEYVKYGCPIQVLQKATGGKWKLFILWLLRDNKRRFGELGRILTPITQSQLTKALRELEQCGFVIRYVYQEVPPKVEYSLSALGQSFVPILEDLYQWGKQYLANTKAENEEWSLHNHSVQPMA